MFNRDEIGLSACEVCEIAEAAPRCPSNACAVVGCHDVPERFPAHVAMNHRALSSLGIEGVERALERGRTEVKVCVEPE